MPKKLRIRIEHPCGENWDHMQPEDRGRFCSSCQKTVVDFSGMSDQEVLSWLTRPGQSICGRFYDDQLDRSLSPLPERKGKWRTIWHLLLAGMLVSSEASAQVPSVRPATGKYEGRTLGEPMIVGKIMATRAVPGLIRARLADASSGLPLAGASIQVGQTGKYIAADGQGRFSILRKTALEARILKISSVGYTAITIPVEKDWPDPGEKTIALRPAAVLLPAVTVRSCGYTKGRMTMGAIAIGRSVTVSQVIKDTFAVAGITKKALTIYPNPVARGTSVTLSIRLDKPGPYQAQLFSASGALIETLQMEGAEKSTTAPMTIPVNLAAGVYFIRLSHPAMAKIYTQQLFVL